jgi:hypothetical protein
MADGSDEAPHVTRFLGPSSYACRGSDGVVVLFGGG